jgi:histidine triad (HIT) family protein
MSSVFSRIIAGELPCDKVFENERILAFKDINPVAPVHLLIVPKKEIPDLQSVSPEDLPLIGEIIAVAQKLAVEFSIADGYCLLTNNGKGGGQIVFHLHFHLIGGRILGHKLA